MPPSRSMRVNSSHAGVGERVGERLDVPGATGRVDHVGEVRLLEQQRLGVAREAAGGLVGTAQLAVEGEHRDGRGAAQPRADGGDGAAQHVHPGVAARDHRGARDGVLRHRAAALRRAADVADAVPAAARGPELGQRRELVGGGGEAELQAGERLVGAQPRLGERAQGGDPRRQRGPELLGVAAAGTVVGQAVGDDGAQLRVARGRLLRVLDEGVAVRLVERGPALRAVEQRVVAERAGDRAGAGLLGEAQQRRGGVRGVAAGLEGDRGEVDEHALEQAVERSDRRAAGVAEHQPERRDAVLQLGHEDVVGLGDLDVGGERVALAHEPPLRDLRPPGGRRGRTATARGRRCRRPARPRRRRARRS